ncbi:DUF4376 domain-containing protein [Aquitalea sp. USM4]|uniref:DUF4376 domain-containing protein n=1 Tax=Aquitalea sp. USM4 TaxID=1590041 RepID=UPI0013F15FA3|nr:DUF4376 domain-containing protein [Aquitalea sp. USM4]
MTIWFNKKDGTLHDDMDGAALALPGWPQGMVKATAEQINPPATLAIVQSTQSAVIDQAYSAAVTADISFTTAAGVTATFQADPDSQQVLSVSLQGYERAGAVPDGFFWKATDNTKVPFTLTDLGALDKAMLDRGWVAFQKKTTLKEAIAAATTVAEVQSITWS